MSCDGPDCQEALAKLHMFIDSEIASADCDQVQQHLDDCGDCMDEFAVEKLVKALVLRSCHETAPSVLRERVLYSIRTVSMEIRFEE